MPIPPGGSSQEYRAAGCPIQSLYVYKKTGGVVPDGAAREGVPLVPFGVFLSEG